MQTTIPIVGSNERDDATNAREACGCGVANADTPGIAAVPQTPGPAAFAAPARRSRWKSASIDIPALGSALESQGYARIIAISGPATCTAVRNFRDGKRGRVNQ